MVSGYILMLVIVKLTSGKAVSVFSQELWGCLVPTALSECAVITILFYYPQADRWEWYQNILIYISIEHPFIGFRAIFSIFVVLFTKGLWASLGAQLVKNPPAMQEILVWLLGCEDLLRSSPTPVFLGFPGGSAGEESTHNAGDLGSTPGLGRSLEKEKAIHSSILAWSIPAFGGSQMDMTEPLWLSLSPKDCTLCILCYSVSAC